MGMEDVFYHSFAENSLVWIFISVGIGALITATIQYVFEHNLPDWRQRRVTKKAIQKYGYPLLLSAKYLHDTIGDHLNNPSQCKDFEKKSNVSIKNDYSCLSIMYLFGSFFGWFRILEREAFLEFVRIYENKGLAAVDLYKEQIFPISKEHSSLYALSSLVNGSYYRMSKLVWIYHSIFEQVTLSAINSIPLAGIPKLALYALGDLVIEKHEEKKSIVSFSDFVRRYSNDDIFRNSYSYVAELFSKLELVSTNPHFSTILLLYEGLEVLIEFQAGKLSRDYESEYSHYVSPEVLGYSGWLRTFTERLPFNKNLQQTSRSLYGRLTHSSFKLFVITKDKKIKEL